MLNGIYELRGIHDMAAAFKFTDSGQFEFFYAYGVSNRNASGTYTISGDTIHLKSQKLPGNDFMLKEQSKDCADFVIQIDHPNDFLKSKVRAMAFKGEKQMNAEADKNGKIVLPYKDLDKIYVQHLIFPDIACLIKDESNGNHCFVLGLNPSLEQVSFKGVDFFMKEDYITCHMNYFLPFEDVRFYKVEE